MIPPQCETHTTVFCCSVNPARGLFGAYVTVLIEWLWNVCASRRVPRGAVKWRSPSKSMNTRDARNTHSHHHGYIIRHAHSLMHFKSNALNADVSLNICTREWGNHSPICNACCPREGRVISAHQWHDAPAGALHFILMAAGVYEWSPEMKPRPLAVMMRAVGFLLDVRQRGWWWWWCFIVHCRNALIHKTSSVQSQPTTVIMFTC